MASAFRDLNNIEYMKKTEDHTVQKKNDREDARQYAMVKSPVGNLLLVADAIALTGLYFVGHNHAPATNKNWTMNERHPVLRKAAKQLQEYFIGKRKSFSILLRVGGAEFQQKVWRQITRIPYGEITT